MVKANQLVHGSVHLNQLSNLISIHDLRSTQGINLTNFDSVLSMVQGIYDKIMLYEIGKWFIINIFDNVSNKRKFIHIGEKPYFHEKVQLHFLKNGLTKNLSMGVIWRNFHTVHCACACGNYFWQRFRESNTLLLMKCESKFL